MSRMKYGIIFLVFYWILFIGMHVMANDKDQVKDITIKVIKPIVKDKVSEYIDFDNPYIKYTGATLAVIENQEIKFNLTQNTKVELTNDSFYFKFKKEF